MALSNIFLTLVFSAAVSFSLTAAAADSCTFSSLDGKIKESLVLANDGGVGANAHFAAARKVFLLREAKVLCSYGSPSDECASEACQMKLPPKFEALCKSAPSGEMKEECVNEAVQAQALFNHLTGTAAGLMSGGDRKREELAANILKASAEREQRAETGGNSNIMK